MNAYIISLILMSALVGISSYLSFFDAKSGFLKTATSIFTVCVIITPILTLVGELGGLAGSGSSPEEFIPSVEETQFSKTAKAAFEEGLKKYVCEEFSLSDSDVTVGTAGFDSINMKAEKIKIVLYGSAVYADARGIGYSVSSLELGECEVELGVR